MAPEPALPLPELLAVAGAPEEFADAAEAMGAAEVAFPQAAAAKASTTEAAANGKLVSFLDT